MHVCILAFISLISNAVGIEALCPMALFSSSTLRDASTSTHRPRLSI